MRRRSVLLPSLALVALGAALPTAARAQSLGGAAPSVVRMLHRAGRTHGLADRRGNIPISIALPRDADARALGLLPVAPGVGAIRLREDAIASFAAAHPDLPLSVSPPFKPLLDVSANWTHVAEFRSATGGISGHGVVVGVVDTGVDVRHPDLRTADGHTRVAWMLTSGSPRGLHADLESEFGCTDETTPCAIYAAADIDAIIAGTLADAGDLNDVDGHGTHVTSIAAGNGGPMVNPTPKYVGLAPDATIVIAAPSADGSFFDTDILNGARFVFDRAAALGSPAVLNLSLGSDYGSHDGTSNVETGLAAFVGDDQPGRAIVVAAGNSGAMVSTAPVCPGPNQTECVAGPLLGIHTEAHVSNGETVRIPMIPGGPATDGEVFVWVTLRPGDDVSVGLEGPCGATWVSPTSSGNETTFDTGTVHGGVVNDVPGADAALNAATNSAIVSFEGGWDTQLSCGGATANTEFSVILTGSGDASLWISPQKDAAATGMVFEQALRQGTINVPASGPALLAVGCTINRLQWTPLDGAPLMLSQLGDDMSPVPDGACYFSSSGPTPFGVEKPEIGAPGGFVAAAMSAGADPRTNPDPNGLFASSNCPTDDACFVVDAYHGIASGTSMSSPHVSGAVALLMGVDPTLTQGRVTAVLQAGARLSTGHFPDPNQIGPGSLDVEGSRLALFESMTSPVEATPSKSWYSLSSAYARPDETWPVWGTVELRTSDGSVAASIDGSRLAVSLEGGGVIVQPLTRVRPGLYRFAFAGGPEDLGHSLMLDVLYDGGSLGQRVVPVGWDDWSASDPTVGAVGACAYSSRRGDGSGHSRGAWPLTLLATAGLLMFSRTNPSGRGGALLVRARRSGPSRAGSARRAARSR